MVGGGQGAFIGAVHRYAARLDDRYELVAGCFASTPERSRASAAALGVAAERAYGSFAEMATAEAGRDNGIDVVSIVTPNHLHYPAARAFLEAGIHVVCDKPLTTTLGDARRAGRPRRPLRPGLRPDPQLHWLSHDAAGPGDGGGRGARPPAHRPGRVRPGLADEAPGDRGQKQAAWRADPARSGPGGCVTDIGTHALNLARFVTGLELEAVCADLTTFVEGSALDDDVRDAPAVRGRRARQPCGRAKWRRATRIAFRMRVYGERAGLTWAQEDPNYLHFAPHGEPPQLIRRGRVRAPARRRPGRRVSPRGTPRATWRASPTSTSTPPSRWRPRGRAACRTRGAVGADRGRWRARRRADRGCGRVLIPGRELGEHGGRARGPKARERERRPMTATFFDPHQRATIEAAMARIIPTDDQPGAREAGTIDFLDRYLSGLDFIYAKPDGSGFEQLKASAPRPGGAGSRSCARSTPRAWPKLDRREPGRVRPGFRRAGAGAAGPHPDRAGARRAAAEEAVPTTGPAYALSTAPGPRRLEPAMQQTSTETELDFLPLLVDAHAPGLLRRPDLRRQQATGSAGR